MSEKSEKPKRGMGLLAETLFPKKPSSSNDIASSESQLASRNQEVVSSKLQVATNKPKVTNNESQLASSESEVTSSKSQVATRKSRDERDKLQVTSHKSEVVSSKSQVVSGDSEVPEMKEYVEKATKQARITTWSPMSVAVLQYIHSTTPRFSMSNEIRDILEEGIRDRYPELWKAAEKALEETK